MVSAYNSLVRGMCFTIIFSIVLYSLLSDICFFLCSIKDCFISDSVASFFVLLDVCIFLCYIEDCYVSDYVVIVRSIKLLNKIENKKEE